MQTVSGNPVIIVGAGPTGLVLAIELARRGVPFHLIDRLEQPLGWDRAIFIKSRSLEVFAGLGLADRFLRRGRPVHGIDLYSEAEKVANFRFAGLDTPFPYILSIPENETEDILNEQLVHLGGDVERGVEFLGLEQSESGVRVRVRSQAAGERVLEASWVVGTDGLHSPVREAIDDSFDGRDYRRLWGVVDAAISGWRHPREITCVQLEPPIVIPFPLGDDRWRIYFRADTDNPDVLVALGDRLAVVSPGARLLHPDEPRFFHAHSRVARRFRTGRVVIAGDAAHVSNPIEGHGMNLGIQDAYNLGWKLALAVSGKAAPGLMDSYEAERRPVAQAIIDSGDVAEARALNSASDARRELVAFLSTAEGRNFAALAESEIQFGYDQSPIVTEFGVKPGSSGHGTRIGYRVGDVTGLVGRQRTLPLHELIAVPEHTLLLMLGGAAPPVVEEALARINAAAAGPPRLRAHVVVRTAPTPERIPDGVLCDPNGDLHDRLAADGPTMCLIRPDGHLGFRCQPPSFDTLDAYLRRLFAD
jgi:2-polyprenyl-6-methoxyphenol hydroxylase-like FAD-dependent oxidoreductase